MKAGILMTQMIIRSLTLISLIALSQGNIRNPKWNLKDRSLRNPFMTFKNRNSVLIINQSPQRKMMILIYDF
jgi:hypothetical protein